LSRRRRCNEGENRIMRLILLLLSICFAQNAPAQYFCKQEKSWSCLGVIEVSFSGKEDAGVIRLTVYSNGDSMAEAKNAKAGDSKLLLLKPDKRLYAGVPDDEIKRGHAFMFFDYGFAYPLLALQTAFPDGPATVPEKETETPVLLEKEQMAKLTTQRVSAQRVNYRFVMKGDLAMSGFWDGEQRSPLPDHLSMEKWKDGELRTYTTLGAARVKK
jgi:hypothetical protein